MASLESGVGYLYLDTVETLNVPALSKPLSTSVLNLYQNSASSCKGCAKNNDKTFTESDAGALGGRENDRLTMLSAPLLPGHKHGRGDRDGRVGTYENAHDQGE